MSGEAYYSYQAKARGLHTQEDVTRLYQEMEPVYDRLLKPVLPSDRKAPIYEVACGPGLMLRYLGNRGFTNIKGSDTSAEQVKLAKAAHLSVNEADSIQELKLAEKESFRCIIGIDFIEHLPKDVLIEFLKIGYDRLQPGGILILRAPNGDSPFVGRNLFNDITHEWAYTSVALQALLQMAGFAKVSFLDEAAASLQKLRWFKLPLMLLFQTILKLVIVTATRERIACLSPSIYIIAYK